MSEPADPYKTAYHAGFSAGLHLALDTLKTRGKQTIGQDLENLIRDHYSQSIAKDQTINYNSCLVP